MAAPPDRPGVERHADAELEQAAHATLAGVFINCGQNCLAAERILGIGYLETQQKLQVHFLMLIAAGTLFTVGVALFLWDFFFLAGRPVTVPEREGLATARSPAV